MSVHGDKRTLENRPRDVCFVHGGGLALILANAMTLALAGPLLVLKLGYK